MRIFSLIPLLIALSSADHGDFDVAAQATELPSATHQPGPTRRYGDNLQALDQGPSDVQQSPQEASAGFPANPLRMPTADGSGAVPTLADPVHNVPFDAESAQYEGASGEALRGVAPPTTAQDKPFTQTRWKPSEIAQQIYRTPESGQLSGVTLSLAEAVRGATSLSVKTQRARSYWDLSAAVADYYLSLIEANDLDELVRHSGQGSSAQWQMARTEQTARIEACRRSAVAAQYQLQRLLENDRPASLPIPADRPHAGRYETRYHEIFAASRDLAAGQLHEALPHSYAALQAQAGQIEMATERLQDLAQQDRSGAPTDDLLPAYRLLSLSRQAFVHSLHRYNRQIADYIELAAPDDVAPQRLVAMLISSSSDRRQWESPNVEVASANEPISEFGDGSSHGFSADPEADQSSAAQTGSPPRTYRDNRSHTVRRPIRDFFRSSERSILVRPLRRLRDN